MLKGFYLFSEKRCRIFFIPVIVLFLSACSGSLFEEAGDVGNCKFPGRMSYDKSSKIYTLTGAGTNMWQTSDEFFMVWKKVSGDFSLSAKIAFEGEGVNAHRKMGLIIRESLDADAVYADVAVHGDGLTSLQYRRRKGRETQELVSPNKTPDHLVLERIDSRIRMKTGFGGCPEQSDGELMINLPDTCYVGLFICSHDADVLETGYFSDVVFEKK